MIYLDNAATSCPKPPEVAEAMSYALSHFSGVGRGVHPASLEAGSCVYDAREAVARLLGNPDASRVAFGQNATAALNMAIASLVPDGGVAVATAASHNSVLRPLFKKRDENGVEVRVVPVDVDGRLDWRALEKALEGADVFVATHASNLTGDVYDAPRMAEFARAAGAVFVLDAAQTAGCYPIDQAGWGVDVVCFTGHKSLLGPQGTGGLSALGTVELHPLLEGGSGAHSYDERHPRTMPDALEAGTVNAHGLAGLLAGVAYVEKRGVDEIRAHEARLADRLAAGIAPLGGVRILGAREPGKTTGIVAFAVDGTDSAEIADELAFEYGVCTRAGAHCAPLMHKALGTVDTGAVRMSTGPFTTEEEVDATIAAAAEILGADA